MCTSYLLYENIGKVNRNSKFKLENTLKDSVHVNHMLS